MNERSQHLLKQQYVQAQVDGQIVVFAQDEVETEVPVVFLGLRII